MNKKFLIRTGILAAFISTVIIPLGCNPDSTSNPMDNTINIAFLHHSTGQSVWNGNSESLSYKIGRVVRKITGKKNNGAKLPRLVKDYNKKSPVKFTIDEIVFPKTEPYGWKNYPYDYYNIWVKNAGEQPYAEEPTLEMLTGKYQVIMFKHCFPVSNIGPDADSTDINSEYKSLPNYKLQYLALRDKMHGFPDTRFIVWTGAIQVESLITEEEAVRTREFFTWVKDTWDLPDDNIYIWDFYALQTDGGLYFPNAYARSAGDSHPNNAFSEKAASLLVHRIADILENKGSKTNLLGELR